MIRTGLCSVTFRRLPVDEVIDLAASAGLDCIEWGGDVHVPPGDPDRATAVREATLAAGLDVASYGSYLRCEGSEHDVDGEAEAVLASAQALGAPRIRIWAGSAGSSDATAEERRRVVAGIRRTASLAAEHRIDLGLEWHGGTLTDEIGSTLALLEEVGAENVRSYWQPHQDQPTRDALDDLRRALPRVSTVHAFSWWPGGTRLPLADRADLWRPAVEILEGDDQDHDILLEFVPGDDPSLLAREAATLRSLRP